jgi:hypothetical protein
MLYDLEQLTPEAETGLLMAIRSGAFPHLAAEAYGVPRQRFAAWLARGRRKGTTERYRRFAEEVRQAIAKARIRAEMQALVKDPKFWLKHGPGKETTTSPGWTNPAKAQTAREREGVSDAELSRLLAKLLQVLQGFPEAHAAVVEALREFSRCRSRVPPSQS